MCRVSYFDPYLPLIFPMQLKSQVKDKDYEV